MLGVGTKLLNNFVIALFGRCKLHAAHQIAKLDGTEQFRAL
jgi:hypothetical protein